MGEGLLGGHADVPDSALLSPWLFQGKEEGDVRGRPWPAAECLESPCTLKGQDHPGWTPNAWGSIAMPVPALQKSILLTLLKEVLGPITTPTVEGEGPLLTQSSTARAAAPTPTGSTASPAATGLLPSVTRPLAA